jgi:hypothetical protein
MLIENDLSNSCATQETVAVLCCVPYPIDIDGGSTKSL